MLEIAICDDNGNDLNAIMEMLHEICTEMKQEYHVSAFQSPNDMLDRQKKIDIGILDIVMPDCNGIDLGKKLKEKFSEIALIYTTSYEEYCRQAINKVHAFSFLVKPFDKAELKEQIAEALSGISNTVVEKEFYKVIDNRKKEYSVVRLNLSDILYFEYIKRQRRAAIVLENERYECDCVFEKLVEELEQYDYAVNSRGNLVNLRHVEKIKGFVVYLDNGDELPIAQKRIMEFREKLNDFLQGNI